jgi:hypothetical protein
LEFPVSRDGERGVLLPVGGGKPFDKLRTRICADEEDVVNPVGGRLNLPEVWNLREVKFMFYFSSNMSEQ